MARQATTLLNILKEQAVAGTRPVANARETQLIKVAARLAIPAFIILLIIQRCSPEGLIPDRDKHAPQPPEFGLSQLLDGGDQAAVIAHWQRPRFREDGSALAPEFVQGYLLVLMTDEQRKEAGLSTLRDDNSLARQLNGPKLAAFTKEHGHLVRLINDPEQSSIRIQGRPGQRWHAALSAIDQNGQAGPLSRSIPIELPQ